MVSGINATYFTSDQHFGHANIIKYCNRPFSSVYEMDNYLIKQWNNKVGDDDTVFILGDLFFRNAYSPEKILENLNGRKNLIIGNHDKYWTRKVDIIKHFDVIITSTFLVTMGDHRILLSHYPIYDFNNCDYMIHGHNHNNINPDHFLRLQSNPNMLNAGVEINNYMPVSLDELCENNRQFLDRNRVC